MAFTCGCAPWDGVICSTHCQWQEGCMGDRHTPECIRGERVDERDGRGWQLHERINLGDYGTERTP